MQHIVQAGRDKLSDVYGSGGNRSLVRNVTVIICAECVSQHHLVVEDLTLGDDKRERKKHAPLREFHEQVDVLIAEGVAGTNGVDVR